MIEIIWNESRFICDSCCMSLMNLILLFQVKRPSSKNITSIKWFKSRFILVTGEISFHIALWEKEKNLFINKMNMHLKMISKIQEDFQFSEAKGCFLFITEFSTLNTPA